jgi:betaine reductase
VLEKEIERVGIPTVLVTALIPTAKAIGANRIVQGIGITNPLGNPRISRGDEKALRRKLLTLSLELLSQKISPGKGIRTLEDEDL